MIHPRITLVTADYIATERGISVEAVHEMVDGLGDNAESFTWVFNIAPAMNIKRELRFWAKEVINPAQASGLSLEAVLKAIIPRREAVPGQFVGLCNWEVRELLRVSRRTLIELREELKAVPHNGGIYVPRQALEDFFRRRWVFASVPKQISLPMGTR